MKASQIKIWSAMRDYGQMVNKITFQVDADASALTRKDFICENCFFDLSAKKPIDGIRAVNVEGTTVTLSMDWFLYRIDFLIRGVGAAEGIVIDKQTASKTELEHGDWFSYNNVDGVNYRLYTPRRAGGARPLCSCMAAEEAGKTMRLSWWIRLVQSSWLNGARICTYLPHRRLPAG